MAYDEKTAKVNLHRHLQGYKGQELSFENVKDLMSFVFDMVKDPNVAWVSKDSHIRLLNGIFKKVGQTVDDKSIAGIEESVISAFAFRRQHETQNSFGKRIVPDKQNDALLKPNNQAGGMTAVVPSAMDKAAGTLDNEAILRRLHLELVAFENRISKMMEAFSQDSHETAKNLALDKIELEARLAIERAEITSVFIGERKAYMAYLTKEQDELRSLINWFLNNQEEKAKQAEQSLDGRIQALKSVMKIMKDNIEASLSGHTQKHTAGIQKTEGLWDERFISMEQKLREMEEMVSYSRRSLRRMNMLYVFGIIVMAAGFGILLYFR